MKKNQLKASLSCVNVYRNVLTEAVYVLMRVPSVELNVELSVHLLLLKNIDEETAKKAEERSKQGL